MEFKEIFDRHYFSNHHIEAKRLEARLENIFKGHECVLYSSFLGLAISATDELCAPGTRIHINQCRKKMNDMNSFLLATNREKLSEWNNKDNDIKRIGTALNSGLISNIQGALKNNDAVLGFFLDFTDFSDLLESSAAFITQEPELAEKIRWSRSSYGRRTRSTIKIAANGRISEFQAKIINSVLDDSHC